MHRGTTKAASHIDVRTSAQRTLRDLAEAAIAALARNRKASSQRIADDAARFGKTNQNTDREAVAAAPCSPRERCEKRYQ